MKKYLFLFGFLLIMGCSDSKNKNLETEKYEQELTAYSVSFMGELKSVLLSNMKEGGPLQAVTVCSDTAALLTASFAKNNNIYIKRISFNNRNPENYPNEYETEILNNFHNLAKSGNLKNTETVTREVNREDKKFVHFMKPLFVEAPCLNCHGTQEQISEDVKSHLKLKYPNDKAIGYNIGDLRGAISIMKEI